VRHTRLFVTLAIAAAVACSKSSDPEGTGDDPGGDRDPDAGATGDASPDAAPLECFDFPSDPDIPAAIDGVFGASSPVWWRPHDEPPACPASQLLPESAAQVPFVAYAFCNTDTVARVFDFEMLAADGPDGEAPLDDPYLILYRGAGIPADPRDCLGINDDIEGALDTGDSEILGVEVVAGGAVTVVLTTFTFEAATDTGTGYYIGVVTAAD
jgi:hypothetical protein